VIRLLSTSTLGAAFPVYHRLAAVFDDGMADDGRGQEPRRLLPGHDDCDEVRNRWRLGPLAIGTGAFGGVQQVSVDLPVGAGEDEERQRDEAQHGGQAAEQVRHRRVPRRGRWRRRPYGHGRAWRWSWPHGSREMIILLVTWSRRNGYDVGWFFYIEGHDS
jgi:hypothetical protein